MTPKLSIIIPSMNRPKMLCDLLKSLSSQPQRNFKWEVLIINNSNSILDSAILSSFSHSDCISIRIIDEPRPGLHNCRHRGLFEANAEFLAYLDDDMFLGDEWLSGALPIIKNQADAVCGKIKPFFEDKVPAWLNTMLCDPSISGYLGLYDEGEEARFISTKVFCGGNSFLKKDLVIKHGGFHPDGFPSDMLRFRGDGESALMQQFEKAQVRTFYEPKALALHRIAKNRISKDYLYERAYRQGVSDSFSEIRKTKGLDFKLKDSAAKRSEEAQTKVTIREQEQDELNIFRAKTYLSYCKGFLFHQNEVEKDPELLRYVLQKDYF